MKFADIKSRKEADKDDLQKVVNGGQVSIKKSKKKDEVLKTPFQVMLPAQTKNSIKALAATKGISMTELFEEMYDHYKRTHKSMKS